MPARVVYDQATRIQVMVYGWRSFMIDEDLAIRLQRNEDNLKLLTNQRENLRKDWVKKARSSTMSGPALTASNQALGEEPSIDKIIHLVDKFPNVMVGRLLLHILNGIDEDPTQKIFSIISKSLCLCHAQLGFSSRKKLLRSFYQGLSNFSTYPRKIIRDIRLLAAEERLKARIKESEVPFLGLIEGDIRGTIKRAIRLAQPIVSGVNEYIGAMKKYPALLCLRITLKINAGMGQQAINDVWPHVSRAIGINGIPNANDRIKAWTAFRQAIITLGLEPSARIHGQNYMKDEFLRQTGIPVAYIHHLADGMLRFARRNGIPKETDDERIREWQKALCETEELGTQTVLKAVSLDTKGYFAHRFISIQNDGLSG